MFVYAMRPGAVAGEEANRVVREEGVEGDGQVAGPEEDERPVEGETPDCRCVVEVDAACGGEEVGEVERGPRRGFIAFGRGRDEGAVEGTGGG